MPEELMTIDDVAAYFDVTKKTIYRWNTEGRGPVRLRIAGRAYYRPSDVEAFVTESQVSS